MSQKQLILHFDLNGTITNYDSTEDSDISKMANLILAKNAQGKIIDNKWILIDPPFEEKVDSISYYNYLKLVDSATYKAQAFNFTCEGQPGQPLQKECQRIELSGDVFAIFPSFINILKQYPEAKLVFRTFGNDRDLIVEQLKTRHKYNLSFCYGEMTHHNGNVILKIKNGSEYVGNRQINNFINSCPNNIIIKEDYHHWNQNKKNKANGKILVIDPSVDQLIFDDNDCVVCQDLDGNIIENCNKFIKINTIKAQLDEEFYIKHVKSSLHL